MSFATTAVVTGLAIVSLVSFALAEDSCRFYKEGGDFIAELKGIDDDYDRCPFHLEDYYMRNGIIMEDVMDIFRAECRKLSCHSVPCKIYVTLINKTIRGRLCFIITILPNISITFCGNFGLDGNLNSSCFDTMIGSRGSSTTQGSNITQQRPLTTQGSNTTSWFTTAEPTVNPGSEGRLPQGYIVLICFIIAGIIFAAFITVIITAVLFAQGGGNRGGGGGDTGAGGSIGSSGGKDTTSSHNEKSTKLCSEPQSSHRSDETTNNHNISEATLVTHASSTTRRRKPPKDHTLRSLAITTSPVQETASSLSSFPSPAEPGLQDNLDLDPSYKAPSIKSHSIPTATLSTSTPSTSNYFRQSGHSCSKRGVFSFYSNMLCSFGIIGTVCSVMFTIPAAFFICAAILISCVLLLIGVAVCMKFSNVRKRRRLFDLSTSWV